MITDDQPEVLSCPACGRPLESVTGRCPGCGTHLVLAVQAKRAGVFTSFGVVIGLLVGAAAMGMVAGATRSDATAVGARGQTGTQPSQPTPAGQVPPAIPSVARSAITQSVVINGRLVASLTGLRTELTAATFDTVAVAQALRALAADAQFGDSLAPQLARWPAAARLSAELASFYGSIRSTAREGLSASLTNAAAYQDAGTKMVAQFAVLPALDGLTQQLAAEAGVTVPAVALPSEPASASEPAPAPAP